MVKQTCYILTAVVIVGLTQAIYYPYQGSSNLRAFNLQPECVLDEPVVQAMAVINTSGSITAADGSTISYSVSGTVKFTQIDRLRTRIQATFTGVKPFLRDSNEFAMHVHQLGTTSTCAATASHYNPCLKDHSDDPLVQNRHVGDVAKVEIEAGSDTVTIDQIDHQVKLSGRLSVLGRSVVIHAGASAARVGCAPIVVAEWE